MKVETELGCCNLTTWSNVSKPDNWDGTERRGDFVLYRARSNPPFSPGTAPAALQATPCPSVRPTVCLAAAAAAPFPKPDKGASYSFEARMHMGYLKSYNVPRRQLRIKQAFSYMNMSIFKPLKSNICRKVPIL